MVERAAAAVEGIRACLAAVKRDQATVRAPFKLKWGNKLSIGHDLLENLIWWVSISLVQLFLWRLAC